MFQEASHEPRQNPHVTGWTCKCMTKSKSNKSILQNRSRILLGRTAPVNNTKPHRDTDARTIAGHSWGALEGGTLAAGGVWLPQFQPTPDGGQHLHGLILVPFHPLSVRAVFIQWWLLLPLGLTALRSEKGIAALVRERLRNDKVALTPVLSPHRVPSSSVLKGTGKTLKRKKNRLTNSLYCSKYS